MRHGGGCCWAFIKGADLGGSQEMRYALIATVPIPLEIAKKGWTRMVLYMLVNVKTLAVYLARKTPKGLKPLEVLKSVEAPKIHKVQKNVHELLKIKISGGALLHGPVGHGGPHNADGPLDMVPEVDASNGVDIDDGDIEEGGLTESDLKMVEKMNARWREHRDDGQNKMVAQEASGRSTQRTAHFAVRGWVHQGPKPADEQWLGGERPKRPCPTCTGCDPDGPSC